MGLGDMLAAATVEAFKQPAALYQAKDVGGLIACLDDPNQASEAARYLLALGGTTIEALDRYLRHDDKKVRLAAAAAYARLAWEQRERPALRELAVDEFRWGEGARKAVDPLAEAARDRSHAYREMAVTALGWTGEAQAVESLTLVLTERRMEIREAAARALVMIGELAVEPLIDSLQDMDWIVRERAAWALGEIGDSKSVAPLIQALEDGDSDVCLTAHWALLKMADESAEAGAAVGDQAAVKCWYCEQRSANPLAAVETIIKRDPARAIVRVPRCDECKAIHSKGTGGSKLAAALIMIASLGSCLATKQIYASVTGGSSWIPAIVVGLVVSVLVVGIFFTWFFRAHGGATKARLAHQTLFPKIQEMGKEGWKVHLSPP